MFFPLPSLPDQRLSCNEDLSGAFILWFSAGSAKGKWRELIKARAPGLLRREAESLQGGPHPEKECDAVRTRVGVCNQGKVRAELGNLWEGENGNQ